MKATSNQIADQLRAFIASYENELGILRHSLAILSHDPATTLAPSTTPVKVKVKAAPAPKAKLKAKSNVMSDEGRERVAEAQRKRWAKIKREQRAEQRAATAKQLAKSTAKKKKPVAAKPAKPATKANRAVRMSDSIPGPAPATAA